MHAEHMSCLQLQYPSTALPCHRHASQYICSSHLLLARRNEAHDLLPLAQVLDMCAAPGSKTFQLLEMLHNMEGASAADGGSSSSGTTPTGFVVANDADAQRCNLLTHQTKRMCSPCLMVTNHNGQEFPRITGLTAAPGSAAAAAAAAAAAVNGSGGGGEARQAGEVLLFDRVLCDVPCSGDGTMRKAPDIWRRWSVNNGNGLHNMQLRIALQAVRLLKVGLGWHEEWMPVWDSVGCLEGHPVAVCDWLPF